MLPQEYIEERNRNFIREQGENDDLWKQLKSQINSSLRLGLSQDDISEFIDIPYDYEQREVLKFGLWYGTDRALLESFTSETSYRNMMTGICEAGMGKPLDSMEQVMGSVLDTLNLLKTESDARNAEQEKIIEKQKNDIRNLEKKLAESEDKVEKIMSATDENSRVNILELKIKELQETHSKELSRINEENELRRMKEDIETMRRKAEDEIHIMTEELEKKKYRLDLEIENKAQQIAENKFADMKKKFEEEQKIIESVRNEERLKAENNVRGNKKKRSVRYGRKNSDEVGTGFQVENIRTPPGNYTVNSTLIDFNTMNELPENFDIGSYMMKTDLPSDIYDIICVGVKCGCPDYMLKQMIDSRLPGEKLKPLMEIYLAKRARESKFAMEENADDESDIKYM